MDRAARQPDGAGWTARLCIAMATFCFLGGAAQASPAGSSLGHELPPTQRFSPWLAGSLVGPVDRLDGGWSPSLAVHSFGGPGERPGLFAQGSGRDLLWSVASAYTGWRTHGGWMVRRTGGQVVVSYGWRF